MLFISLTLAEGKPTYRLLREFVKATAHIDDDEELGLDFDEYNHTFRGLIENVETLASKEV